MLFKVSSCACVCAHVYVLYPVLFYQQSLSKYPVHKNWNLKLSPLTILFSSLQSQFLVHSSFLIPVCWMNRSVSCTDKAKVSSMKPIERCVQMQNIFIVPMGTLKSTCASSSWWFLWENVKILPFQTWINVHVLIAKHPNFNCCSRWRRWWREFASSRF